jgi:predicted HTH domain antitoxin
MSTFTVQVEVPDELKNLGFTPESIQRALPSLLVLKRFREGSISSGKATELLSITRQQFLDLLQAEKIPLFDLSRDDASQDFQMAQRLAGKL